METNELHRGRLIDHLQLIVHDLAASETFYQAMVQAFHKAALAAGGTDNGAPGFRPYHPNYYAAFVLDPDGNNIEAVFHGEAQRSAPSVKVTF